MLIPPRGPRMSQLTPNEFLTSPEAMSPLKRKAHLSRPSNEPLKKIRLDPAPKSEDATIMEYHARVRLLLPEDRDKVRLFGVHVLSFGPNVEPRDMFRERLHILIRPVLKLASSPQTSKTDSEMIISSTSAYLSRGS